MIKIYKKIKIKKKIIIIIIKKLIIILSILVLKNIKNMNLLKKM